ncbi:MAG: hypothetical protein ACOCXH_10855 [Cyclobacteriaceae bacterium]
MELQIKIPINEPFSPKYLRLRYIIEDTIESRKIGEVWDSTIGHDFLEIFIDYNGDNKKLQQIKMILSSLGFYDNIEFNNF